MKTNTQTLIHLRPHHGMCLPNFRGMGYSDQFSRNMANMRELLYSVPSTRIEITRGADDLCRQCPNRRGDECESAHPPLFDQNVLRTTGLSYGQVLSWKEFLRRTEPLIACHLSDICPGCEWLALCQQIVNS